MTLEDEIGDIVGKALLGNGLSRQELSKQVGRPQAELDALIDQHTLPKSIAHLAQWVCPLDIDAQRLSKLSKYPESAETDHPIHQIITPFGHLGVNSWWLPKVGPGILIDAGTSASPIIRQLNKLNATPKELWITHGHHDHLAGTEDLRQHYPDLVIRGPQGTDPDHTLMPGDTIHGIEVIDLDGHWPGALGYLANSLFAVGDAFFKGSIGKIPPEKWHVSLTKLRKLINQLPKETILLPGHGPITRVAVEKQHNPMLGISSAVPKNQNFTP